VKTDYFSDVFQQITPTLKSMWQASASKHGWSKEATDAVDMAVNHEGLFASYAPHMQHKVENHEFGHLESRKAPAPAMREYAQDAEGEISSAFGERLVAVLSAKIMSKL
jgi:hypothetical protein